MNVLLIQPSNALAGAEMSALQVMEGLSLKYNVTCYAVLPPPEDSVYVSMLKKSCAEVLTLPLFTWHRLKSASLKTQIVSLFYRLYKTRILYSVWRLLKFVKSHEIDAVYSNSGLCPVGGIVSKMAGIPHIWHIRERVGSGSEFPLLLGDRLSRSFFMHWSDIILCNSRFSAMFFHDKVENLKVILNGIETKKFIAQDAVVRGRELRRALGFSDQTVVVGMVGSIFSAWKEHALFLQVVKILKDDRIKANYVIFGGSKDSKQSEYARTVFRMAEELEIESDVVFAELQSDIPAMMNSMDVMLHPTSQEGSGRVIMEAMAAGKPVVGVNAGGVAELIVNGQNGWSVEARRPDLLASALLLIIQNERLKSEIGKRAADYAQRYFQLERTQAEIYKVIESVINGV